MTFVPLHHVQKGTRLSPFLLFIVVVRGESLGTRLIIPYIHVAYRHSMFVWLHTAYLMDSNFWRLGTVELLLNCVLMTVTKI